MLLDFSLELMFQVYPVTEVRADADEASSEFPDRAAVMETGGYVGCEVAYVGVYHFCFCCFA